MDTKGEFIINTDGFDDDKHTINAKIEKNGSFAGAGKIDDKAVKIEGTISSDGKVLATMKGEYTGHFTGNKLPK